MSEHMAPSLGYKYIGCHSTASEWPRMQKYSTSAANSQLNSQTELSETVMIMSVDRTEWKLKHVCVAPIRHPKVRMGLRAKTVLLCKRLHHQFVRICLHQTYHRKGFGWHMTYQKKHRVLGLLERCILNW